jgi:trehalose-6-phosphate synthase
MNEESFAPEAVYLKNVVIINEYAISRRNEELSPALRDELNEGNLQLAERIC